MAWNAERFARLGDGGSVAVAEDGGGRGFFLGEVGQAFVHMSLVAFGKRCS